MRDFLARAVGALAASLLVVYMTEWSIPEGVGMQTAGAGLAVALMLAGGVLDRKRAT